MRRLAHRDPRRLGAFAFGIGSSEVEHVLATQCLWQRKPNVMRVSVTGTRAPGIAAKDVILAIIAKIGAGGGGGHAIEYAGPVIAGMTMDERITVCNMSIEAGDQRGPAQGPGRDRPDPGVHAGDRGLRGETRGGDAVALPGPAGRVARLRAGGGCQ